MSEIPIVPSPLGASATAEDFSFGFASIAISVFNSSISLIVCISGAMRTLSPDGFPSLSPIRAPGRGIGIRIRETPVPYFCVRVNGRWAGYILSQLGCENRLTKGTGCATGNGSRAKLEEELASVPDFRFFRLGCFFRYGNQQAIMDGLVECAEWSLNPSSGEANDA